MRKALHTDQHVQLRSLLRERRLAADLTQQELADTLGTTQSYVAKYEGGERRLDVLEFVAVARALNADPADLLRALFRADAQISPSGRATKQPR
jgi:transcriptional regulator with XRE-family HTH domain